MKAVARHGGLPSCRSGRRSPVLRKRFTSRAFNEIVRRYYQPVYRLAWRMGNGNADTEDITQEAFM